MRLFLLQVGATVAKCLIDLVEHAALVDVWDPVAPFRDRRYVPRSISASRDSVPSLRL